MGRYAGWIALHSGIAGGAGVVILIPEIPYSINSVIGKIRGPPGCWETIQRIIVVAEGARPVGGEMSIARIVKGSFEPIRLGGAGEKLVRGIRGKNGYRIAVSCIRLFTKKAARLRLSTEFFLRVMV